MKKRQLLLTLLCMAAFTAQSSQTATADNANTDTATEPTKQYDVEVIIFEDAHARYLNSEAWDNNTVAEETANSNKTLTGTFKSIKPSILTKEYKRIKQSSEFKVMQYSAWRQEGLDKSKAFAINIAELSNNSKNKTRNSVTGTLKVVLARYLHFYSDLRYSRTANDGEAASDTAADQRSGKGIISDNVYPVKAHRRMRSRELHYIDHPLLGILVQINPVEAPAESAQ